VQIPPFGLI